MGRLRKLAAGDLVLVSSGLRIDIWEVQSDLVDRLRVCQRDARYGTVFRSMIVSKDKCKRHDEKAIAEMGGFEAAIIESGRKRWDIWTRLKNV